MLSDAENIAIVASVTDVNKALELLESQKIDILISDISMPNLTGIELASIISKKYPKIGIILLTMYANEDYIFNAIRNGAKGYLTKQETSKAILIEAVKLVFEGNEYFSPNVSKLMMNSYLKGARKVSNSDVNKNSELTIREKEILKMYAEGLSNKEIADKLKISIRTVETHKNNIMQKNNFKSTVDLIKYALKNNIIEWE